jgi:hypothetical protein
MSPSLAKHINGDRMLTWFVALCGWSGLLGIFFVVLVGFEEPDHTLLLVSSILLVAAPIAVLVHLWRTTQLTSVEKRLWLRELTGRNAARAFSAYLSRSTLSK